MRQAALLLAAATLWPWSGRADPAQRGMLAAMVEQEAARRGLPPGLAAAVATVESGWDPTARGADGEVGLMQILPGTAALLGFTGTLPQLAEPETNIRLGVQYLGGAWLQSRGDLCTALMKYRAGHGETLMSPLSAEYCLRVRRNLAAAGSPLADAPAPVVSALRLGRRRVESSEHFWAVRAIRVQASRTRLIAAVTRRRS